MKTRHLIQTTVTPDLIKRLKRRAAKEGLVVSAYVRRLIVRDDLKHGSEEARRP